MSNYVISGKNQYVAEERLKQIIKEARCNKDNVIDIDGEDARKFQIDAALYECNVVSLFEENQARCGNIFSMCSNNISKILTLPVH